MKRLHVNVTVPSIEDAIGFYSSLFGDQPTVVKPDYAKWMLEDPRVNFAVSLGEKLGVEHLGIQAETPCELASLFNRADTLRAPQFKEGEVTCCYAKSKKTWITDTAGVAWELFHTHGDSETRNGAGAAGAAASEPVACCAA